MADLRRRSAALANLDTEASPGAERCLRDIVALSTLPAVWHGAEPMRVAESLAAALFTTVQPDFAYVCFLGCSDEGPITVAQTGRYGTDPGLARAIGPALLQWARTHDPDEVMLAQGLVGPGTLRIATRALAFDADSGVIAAGFVDDGAPDASQLLLLNIAATQATTAVQNAKLLRTLRATIAERERGEARLAESERRLRDIIEALPAAVYTTDADGRLTHFNQAAVEFSGGVPELGTDQWCVSWKLYRPDGTPLPHDESSMAVSLKEGRAIRGEEAIAERSDGERRWFETYPTPLRDSDGTTVGGVNMLVDVTERKRVENALRKSERRQAAELAATRALQEVSVRMIQSDDVEALFEGILDAALVITGSSLGSMQIVDEDHDALRMLALRGFEPALAKVFELNSANTCTSGSVATRLGRRVVVPDVETCDFIVGTPALEDHRATGIRAVQSTPLVTRSGHVLGMISTYWREPHEPSQRELDRLDVLARLATDVIERRRAEEALRQSEVRYRRLVGLLPAGVYTCEAPSGAITFYNDHAALLWGRAPKVGATEELFCGSYRLWRPDGVTLPHAETPMALALGEGREFRNQEIVIERPDGSRITVLVNIDPIRDDTGRVVGAINVFHDTTDLRHAERAVRESEERFRTLVSIITDVPWTTDPEGAFSRPQSAWAAFTGQSWEEHRGFGWVNALHPDDRAAVKEIWERARTSRGVYESRGRLWHAPTRQYRQFVARATPVLRPDGSVAEWVGTCTDVTAEREASAEREHLLATTELARAEAEEANRAKDDFLAVLSHELRSPIHAMLAWLRILKTSGTADRDLASRAIETLERNIRVQVQVINDLLDVSRILSGKLQLDQERLEFSALVHGCVESLRPSAQSKQIALRFVMNEHALELVGDGTRLQQVVGNLLGNAIKFTNAGGSITVTVGRSDRSALLTIEDSGQGIAPEFVPHLFERFRQADSSRTRAHGGLGLGLSIAKNLVALHGGEIRAESEGRGRGARFSILLPLAEAPPRFAFRASHATTVRDGNGPLPSLDILLVEDDPDTRDALHVALGENGSRVRSAASVREALEAYDVRPPDVLISDIGMSGEDGYVLIRAIREREAGRGHRTIAIAMTGFAGRQDQEMALRAGFDEHVAKPIEPDALCDRIYLLAASRSDAAHR